MRRTPNQSGAERGAGAGRVMQHIPLYLNISIWTISIKDTSEIQNIQHRKQIITLTYRCGTRGKMLWAQVSCAAAPARGTCHLVHMKSSLGLSPSRSSAADQHSKCPHLLMAPGPRFRTSSSHHGVASGGFRAHSSPNKVQQLNDGLHTRGLGGGDGGSWQRSVMC